MLYTIHPFCINHQVLAKNTLKPEDQKTPRMKPTCGDTLKRDLERRNDIECKHNLFQQAIKKKDELEYGNDEAAVAGHFTTELLRKHTFGQQHTLAKGLQKFGEQGVKGTEKETGQLHDQTCFKPVRIKDMTSQERRKAQIALAHLTEKKSGEVKAHTCLLYTSPSPRD